MTTKLGTDIAAAAGSPGSGWCAYVAGGGSDLVSKTYVAITLLLPLSNTADNAPRIAILARRIAVGSSALDELVGDVEPRGAAKLQRVTLRHNEAWLRALQQVSVLNLSVTCSLFWSAGRLRSLFLFQGRAIHIRPWNAAFGSADTPSCGRSELRVNEGPVCHSDVFVSPRQGRPSTPFHRCQQRCDRDKAEPRLCGASERLFSRRVSSFTPPARIPCVTAAVRR
jgi:hypothetical protein